MVSLDEEIQKDRDHRKPNKFNKNHKSRDQSRPHKKFGNQKRHPNDKKRAIRKDRNDGPRRKFSSDHQNRGPKRINRGGNRQERQGQQTRFKREQKIKNRIPRPPRKISEQRQAQIAQQKGRTLKVMGLHPDFTNEDLYKLFSTQGALQKCLIEQDNFGRSLTTAIVKYHKTQSAKSAISNLNSHKVMNSILTVQPYKNIPRR